MLKELLSKVANKENLTYDEAKNAIAEIVGGECSPVLISAFLTALSMKGETDEETYGYYFSCGNDCHSWNYSKRIRNI